LTESAQRSPLEGGGGGGGGGGGSESSTSKSLQPAPPPPVVVVSIYDVEEISLEPGIVLKTKYEIEERER